MANQVVVEVDGRVLTATMNRPPANAIDLALSTELYEAFRRLKEDPNLRVGIVTAAPNPKNIFCAGWDLKAVARGEGRDERQGFDLGPGGITLTYEWFDRRPVIGPGRDYYTVDFEPFGFDNRTPLASNIPGILSTGNPSATGLPSNPATPPPILASDPPSRGINKRPTPCS